MPEAQKSVTMRVVLLLVFVGCAYGQYVNRTSGFNRPKPVSSIQKVIYFAPKILLSYSPLNVGSFMRIYKKVFIII